MCHQGYTVFSERIQTKMAAKTKTKKSNLEQFKAILRLFSAADSFVEENPACLSGHKLVKGQRW